MVYRIEIIRAARKQMLSLPREAKVEIALSIDRLANDTRRSRCKKLHGTDLWRLRVGRYRVIYVIDDGAGLVTVVKVAPRREDTYQGL